MKGFDCDSCDIVLKILQPEIFCHLFSEDGSILATFSDKDNIVRFIDVVNSKLISSMNVQRVFRKILSVTKDLLIVLDDWNSIVKFYFWGIQNFVPPTQSRATSNQIAQRLFLTEDSSLLLNVGHNYFQALSLKTNAVKFYRSFSERFKCCKHGAFLICFFDSTKRLEIWKIENENITVVNHSIDFAYFCTQRKVFDFGLSGLRFGMDFSCLRFSRVETNTSDSHPHRLD